MSTIFISFSDIFKYWDTLTQYVNPMTILLWAIMGGIIGFIIMLITEIILRKKILIRRRHWSLKYLSYIYFVFLPLFTGFCFTQWFGLHGCEREMVKNIPTYLGDANSAFNKYLKDEVVKVLEERHLALTGHEALYKAADLAGNTVSSLAQEVQPSDSGLTSKASNFIISKIVENDFIKKQAVKYIVETLGEKVLLDKELTNEVLNVKIENLLENGVLNTVLEKHIRNLFGGFKMNVLLIFLIGLAIPAIEIFIAHKLNKKQLDKDSSPPPYSQENN